MKARNIMEDIVRQHLDQIISSGVMGRDCSNFRDKIIAEVLSNLPAKYVTSETGAMHTVIDQVKVEQASIVLKEIIKAIKNIESHQ